MKNEVLKPSNRLSDWQENYQKKFAEETISFALETADLCYLAFETLPYEDKGLSFSVPREAIISGTSFGVRPAQRPSTAQPAAFAAYILEGKGFPREAIHNYLESLIEITLEPWEYRKYLARCRKKVFQTAKAVENLILKDLTPENFNNQLLGIRELVDEFKGDSFWVQNIRAQLKSVLEVRPILLSRLKGGEFSGSPPIVKVHTLRRMGQDIALAPEQANKINFFWPPNYAPILGSYISSVPTWYPFWTGDIGFGGAESRQ